MNTVKPLRMVLAAPEADRPRLIAEIYKAYWALDRDISDDATLGEIAGAAGLDAAPLLSATRDERIKAELKAATDEAIQAGVCGAPTFVVNRLLFWGQDRLVFVEKALDGWVPASEIQG
jgi:2-hydroxychromene-2-carboxylate isomerase